MNLIQQNLPDPCPGFMTAEEALRFLDHEARLCRDRDAHEAFCLLLPPLLRVMALSSMDDFEALGFRMELHKALKLSTTDSGQPHSPS